MGKRIDQSSHSRSSFTGGILKQVIRYTFWKIVSLESKSFNLE